MKTPMSGKITISHYHGYREGITITIHDEKSGVAFLEIDLTAEALGNSLTGSSRQPCTFELRAANVGKVREHKTETIAFTGTDHKNREAEARAILAPYEVEGWKGDWSDLCNHHRGPAEARKVSFTRFVDAP